MKLDGMVGQGQVQCGYGEVSRKNERFLSNVSVVWGRAKLCRRLASALEHASQYKETSGNLLCEGLILSSISVENLRLKEVIEQVLILLRLSSQVSSVICVFNSLPPPLPPRTEGESLSRNKPIKFWNRFRKWGQNGNFFSLSPSVCKIVSSSLFSCLRFFPPCLAPHRSWPPTDLVTFHFSSCSRSAPVSGWDWFKAGWSRLFLSSHCYSVGVLCSFTKALMWPEGRAFVSFLWMQRTF